MDDWESDGGTDPSKPYLVAVDSRGRFRHWNKVVPSKYWKAGVALCSQSTPSEHLEYLRKTGVETVIAGKGQVDLRRALEELNERFGIQTIRVDSDGTLNGALLREGLVDEVSILVLPQLVGCESPRSPFRASDLNG